MIIFRNRYFSKDSDKLSGVSLAAGGLGIAGSRLATNLSKSAIKKAKKEKLKSAGKHILGTILGTGIGATSGGYLGQKAADKGSSKLGRQLGGIKENIVSGLKEHGWLGKKASGIVRGLEIPGKDTLKEISSKVGKYSGAGVGGFFGYKSGSILGKLAGKKNRDNAIKELVKADLYKGAIKPLKIGGLGLASLGTAGLLLGRIKKKKDNHQ